MYTLTTTICTINGYKIIRLPKEFNSYFSSKGMCMIKVIIDNVDYVLPLEPDGYGSHWFEWPYETDTRQEVILNFEPSDLWIEPVLSQELLTLLHKHHLEDQWMKLTLKAKWSWIRWIRFTKNDKTKLNRIQTTLDMLREGKKRPCCFDHTRCTVTQVSQSGKLLI